GERRGQDSARGALGLSRTLLRKIRSTPAQNGPTGGVLGLARSGPNGGAAPPTHMPPGIPPAPDKRYRGLRALGRAERSPLPAGTVLVREHRRVPLPRLNNP